MIFYCRKYNGSREKYDILLSKVQRKVETVAWFVEENRITKHEILPCTTQHILYQRYIFTFQSTQFCDRIIHNEVLVR